MPSNRVHIAAWHFDEGPPILLGNFYGHVVPNTAQQAALSYAVQAFLDHCESHHAPLAMLLGDFNMERHQVPSCIWLEARGWSDCSSEGTCLSSAQPRRIDWMIASRALQHRTVMYHLDWCTGLATHALQAVDITMGTPSQYLQCPPPEAYPEPAAAAASVVDELNRQACLLYTEDWNKAKASDDVDHMWQVIGRAARHVHTRLAGLPCPPG